MPRPSPVFARGGYGGEPLAASGCVAAVVRLLVGGVLLGFASALVSSLVDDVDALGFIVSAAGLFLIYTAAGGGWRGPTKSPARTNPQIPENDAAAGTRSLDAAGSPPAPPDETAPCSETLHGRFGPEPCPLPAWADVSDEGTRPHALCRPHARAVLRSVSASRIVRH